MAAKPSAQEIRIGRLTLKGTDRRSIRRWTRLSPRRVFKSSRSTTTSAKKWEQAKKDGNTIAAAGAWISDKRYRFALGVSARTKSAILAGQIAYPTSYRQAVARQAAWQQTLREVFKKVDFIALPTLQSTPPPIPPNLKIGILEARMLELQNTVAVNFAGNPALALPIPLHHAGVPVTSLQLIGPRLSEAELLNAGRLVEAAVKK